MRVWLDIGLDFDGIHTFDWEQNEGASAIDVPRSTLDRWTAERESFRVASLRWKRTAEEIEDILYKAEASRQHQTVRTTAAVSPKAR